MRRWLSLCGSTWGANIKSTHCRKYIFPWCRLGSVSSRWRRILHCHWYGKAFTSWLKRLLTHLLTSYGRHWYSILVTHTSQFHTAFFEHYFRQSPSCNAIMKFDKMAKHFTLILQHYIIRVWNKNPITLEQECTIRLNNTVSNNTYIFFVPNTSG